MSDDECYCWRCNGDPPCSMTGDHYFEWNGRCRECHAFNGAMLSGGRYRKATREGRAHGDHYHKSVAAKDDCKTLLRHMWEHDPECAGGCQCGLSGVMMEIETYGFIPWE